MSNPNEPIYGKVIAVDNDDNLLIRMKDNTVYKVLPRYCSVKPQLYIGDFYTFYAKEIVEKVEGIDFESIKLYGVILSLKDNGELLLRTSEGTLLQVKSELNSDEYAKHIATTHIFTEADIINIVER